MSKISEYEQAQMELDEMEDFVEDEAQDKTQEQMEDNKEWQEAYGVPEPEEKQNAHSFLHKAAFESADTVRTSFLSESELGKPLFSVRFLLDMEDIAKFYIDPLVKKLKKKYPDIDNKIADYFLQKIHNTTDSGMSNKGFAMTLNVTRKMDTTRRRERPPLPIQQIGGKK